VEIKAVEPSPPVAVPTVPQHTQLVNVITVSISVNRINKCAEGEGKQLKGNVKGIDACNFSVALV